MYKMHAYPGIPENISAIKDISTIEFLFLFINISKGYRVFTVLWCLAASIKLAD
jgi:hypothetical protein